MSFHFSPTSFKAILNRMRPVSFSAQLQTALLSHGKGKYAFLQDPSTCSLLFATAVKIDDIFGYAIETVCPDRTKYYHELTEIARKPAIYTFLMALQKVGLCLFQVLTKTKDGAPDPVELKRLEHYAREWEALTHISPTSETHIAESGLVAESSNRFITGIVADIRRCIPLLKKDYGVHDISSLSPEDQALLKKIAQILFDLETTRQLIRVKKTCLSSCLPEILERREAEIIALLRDLSKQQEPLKQLMARTQPPLSEKLKVLLTQVNQEVPALQIYLD